MDYGWKIQSFLIRDMIYGFGSLDGLWVSVYMMLKQKCVLHPNSNSGGWRILFVHPRCLPMRCVPTDIVCVAIGIPVVCVSS